MIIDFLNNPSDIGLLMLRIALAVIFIVHGTQKFTMWRIQADASISQKTINLMRLLSIVEPIGGIAILTGFLTQIAAIGLGIIMVGAIAMKIGEWGKSFMGDGGWEFDFVNLAALLALAFLGAGRISVDYLLQV